MPGEAQAPSHSLQHSSPEADGRDVKKRKKSNSGKEKRKRKRSERLKRVADVVIEKYDREDLREEGGKKKRAKTSSTDDDNLNQSPLNLSRDGAPHVLENKKKKKRKGRQHAHHGDEEPDADAIKPPSKSGESARYTAGEKGHEHVQSDAPVEKRNVPEQSETPDAKGGNGSASAKPASSPTFPGKPSKRPLSATVEAPDRYLDGKLTASSKKQGSKETEKNKKKKKQRQSEHDKEESGIKPNKPSTKTGESANNGAVKKRDVPEQNTPDTTGIRQRSATDNVSPSAKQERSTSSPEKLSKQSSKATAERSEKEEDDEKPLDDERLPRTLFVGNVAHTVTRKQLRKIFSKYSPIESIRIRNVIAANPKIPKRAALLAGRLAKFSDSFSAYVVFKQTADIESVLQRAVDDTNMTLLDDHHLRVTKALQTKGKRRQSVFVGNLPFDCRDEELITTFMPVAKECGVNLTNVRVNRDSDTGVCRGCGFVTFDDIMGIQACLNKAGEIKVRNRVVRLERAFKTKNMKSKSYKRKWKAAFESKEQ